MARIRIRKVLKNYPKKNKQPAVIVVGKVKVWTVVS